MAVNKKHYIWVWACFLAYLLSLCYVLFFAEMFGRTEHPGEYRYNLTLFQEIGRYYRLGIRWNRWRLFILNVIGNIGVFIPFGIFIPTLFSRCKNVFLTIILTLQMSLAVEVIQLVTQVGSFDVDDLLLNTIGGLCGYIIWFLFRIIEKLRSKTQRK
uniref:VanZ family protein n=1 Tax=Agathobacter sp. TaxID=2021311 RepID=UPI004056C2A5